MNTKKDADKTLASIKSVIQDNKLNEITQKIIKERDEIVDLFCKAFFVSQEPKTCDELRALFELTELECTLGNDFKQTFRIKLRDKE